MTRIRRSILACLAAATTAGLVPAIAHAQSGYPVKPIRLIVPFTVGGVTDASARLAADLMGKRLGQPINVENRPGASGNIVTEDLVFMLEAMGLRTGIDLPKLLAVRDIVRQALPSESLYGFTPDAGLPLGFVAASAA